MEAQALRAPLGIWQRIGTRVASSQSVAEREGKVCFLACSAEEELGRISLNWSGGVLMQEP